MNGLIKITSSSKIKPFAFLGYAIFETSRSILKLQPILGPAHISTLLIKPDAAAAMIEIPQNANARQTPRMPSCHVRPLRKKRPFEMASPQMRKQKKTRYKLAKIIRP